MVFTDGNKEIIHRLIIVRGCCFLYKVSTIRKRDAAGIAFGIGKHLCISICGQYYRLGRCKIVTAVRIGLKAAL